MLEKCPAPPYSLSTKTAVTRPELAVVLRRRLTSCVFEVTRGRDKTGRSLPSVLFMGGSGSEVEFQGTMMTPDPLSAASSHMLLAKSSGSVERVIRGRTRMLFSLAKAWKTVINASRRRTSARSVAAISTDELRSVRCKSRRAMILGLGSFSSVADWNKGGLDPGTLRDEWDPAGVLSPA